MRFLAQKLILSSFWAGFSRGNDLKKKEVFTNPLLTAMFPVLLPLIDLVDISAEKKN